MKKTHFFSLAPDLLSEAGHYAIYQSCIERSVTSHVESFQVFMHANAKLDNCPSHWIPVFGKKHRWHGTQYRKLLLKYKREAERRIFFCDTFSLLDLVHLWIAFLFMRQPSDELWLISRYGFDFLTFKGKGHRLVFFLLRILLKHRLRLFTDSELLKKSFEARLRTSVVLLPLPHTKIPAINPSVRAPNSLRCYWPGPPRPPKGWDFIRRVLTLAVPQSTTIEMVASQSAALTSSTIAIVSLSPVLSHECYWRELLSCDIVLLPYDPIVYRYSTSGVFVEGIIAGKLPVVREGSWLAYELRRYDLQDLIVDWEDPQFWQNLIMLARNPNIAKKLFCMRGEYRSFHSEELFAERLKEQIK
ncbi:MAG: hypothetical protein LLG04_14085 [Parachlamydia sp.]|nr:hypothetical protein [Parachlamydia sp.]